MSVTNLATPEVLREEAQRWIDSNGLPNPMLVDRAIKFSDAGGDPFSQNPFRHALLALAAELRAS